MRKWLIVLAVLFPAAAPAQTYIQQYSTVTPGHAVKWTATGVVQDGGLGFTSTVNGVYSETLDTAGHLRGTGVAPTLSSCGTSPSISGTDIAGTVTMGTGTPTACTITFSTAYASAPNCVVTWQSNLTTMQYVITAAHIALTQTATSSNIVNYRCDAQSGG